MGTLSVARLPPSLPPRRHQAKESHRQASCTHTQMVRIWGDEWGRHYCQLCDRHQLIGWVYRCVQDHAGTLPQSDFTSPTAHPPRDFEPDWEVTLSDWIIEAIDRGEYTPDQVQRLVEQKIRVKRAIFAQARAQSPPSTRSSNNSSTESTSADRSTFSTLPTTLDEDLHSTNRDVKNDGLLGINPRTETHPRMSVQLNACDLKCCHACRPTYRERAWQILDSVVNEPYVEPPSWELENRPVSDARLLANMAFAEPRNTYDEFSFMIDAAFGGDDLSTQLDDTESRHENTLMMQRTHSFRHKSDFEEAVRGVISLGAESRFANQHNRQVSNSSSLGSVAGADRSMLLMRTASKQAGPNTSARPGPLSSQSSLVRTIRNSGTVEVEDGIAVTEEGVQSGMADIIMQV